MVRCVEHAAGARRWKSLGPVREREFDGLLVAGAEDVFGSATPCLRGSWQGCNVFGLRRVIRRLASNRLRC